MAFKKIGTIALILNLKFLIIKSNQPLILGSEVLVYDEVNLTAEQKATYGVDNPSIPKGKVKILMYQEDGTYLASVISQKNALDTIENNSLARSLSLYHNIFGAEDKEINSSDDSTLANYSAVLDKKFAINAELSSLVKPGDAVTFLQPTSLQTDNPTNSNEQRSNTQPN
jgi:hypothetical protein